MDTPGPLQIETLPTPNPDALMFKVGVSVVDQGTYQYTHPVQAEKSPLARRLFSLDGVVQALITSRFITVNKDPNWTWPELSPAIQGLIREHLRSGDLAVSPDELVVALNTSSPLAQAVSLYIDEELRPVVAQDGGDIQFVGITPGGVVQVRLIGSCASCPSSTATLALGIERTLMEEFDEVTGVEQV